MEEAKRGRGRPPLPPKKLKMLMALGYIDDDGLGHFWPKGIVVDDPQQIAMILSRNFHHFEKVM